MTGWRLQRAGGRISPKWRLTGLVLCCGLLSNENGLDKGMSKKHKYLFIKELFTSPCSAHYISALEYETPVKQYRCQKGWCMVEITFYDHDDDHGCVAAGFMSPCMGRMSVIQYRRSETTAAVSSKNTRDERGTFQLQVKVLKMSRWMTLGVTVVVWWTNPHLVVLSPGQGNTSRYGLKVLSSGSMQNIKWTQREQQGQKNSRVEQ